MKNIIITGANRGIGLELTKQFSDAHFVYAVCRGEFPSDALNENIKVVSFDLLDEDAIKAFAKTLDDDGVAIDLIINNAGIAGGSDAGVDSNVLLDANTVTTVLATNVTAPMTFTLHLIEALKRSEAPSMIAVSSMMGTHALLDEYNAQWWPYSTSKAALSFAVSAFAINEPTIKSISVHPGWVKTRMGGDGAQMEVADSAKDIKKLYENISELESGKMYSHDGQLMDW
jgi:NAD(P)-dependent dehydrogenase (short-subunit alcohol dehydrogenase family)